MFIGNEIGQVAWLPGFEVLATTFWDADQQREGDNSKKRDAFIRGVLLLVD